MIRTLRNIAVLLLVSVATVFVSCNKKDVCELDFPVGAVFVGDWGESASLKFTYRNAESITIGTITGGWKAEVDKASRTLIITAPDSETAEDAQTVGSIHVVAVAKGGDSEGAIIYGYIVDKVVDLSANNTQSNCYVISQPNVKYRFNASVKGNSSESIPTADVKILWAEDDEDISYLNFESDGYASFYLARAKDENGNELTTANRGNMVLAAYDKAGTILWSWHLWLVADKDPLAGVELSNGETIMNFNLGAWDNPNGSTVAADIWRGYGLYYQWGRKDPFLRPEYYDCAQNLDETVYNQEQDYVYVTVKESTSKTGTIDYSVKHPMTFLSSNEDNQGDWLYKNHRNDLWSATEKSIYDPCPHGWRVPSKSTFEVLDISAADDALSLDVAEKLYGWVLTDKANGATSFFHASGYRSYLTGVISNVNYRDEYPYTPKPWVGYYWTAGVGSAAATSSAMHFDLNTSRATVNGYKAVTDQKRGNAMQVRCVKEK